ncbi:O-antigen polysaccharide polymerase Wzy [Treponema sp.]|uniref:O-antigen polysaccharide polymerase Wzy n=1 Tax=Treponema sp. TaxID=166 RepID=UPI00298E6152|nr:rhomboid family intramembrane serine protease [Treponema sp.]
MAKKSSPKLTFDFPVTVTFVIVAVVMFLLDTFAFKGKMFSTILICHGSKQAIVPFNFKSPADFTGLFFFIFGNSGWEMLFSNLIVILLLGQILEERYGSVMLGLMMFISTLISGVLTACISTVPLTGAGCIIFMMAVLVSLTELTKKRIPLSCLLVFVLFLSFEIFRNTKGAEGTDIMQKTCGVLIEMIGGICGSIFGFLVLPKKKSTKTASKKTEVKNDYEDDDDYSSKKKTWSSSSSDETVIGTLS